MTPVETLREAARLMRERAEADALFHVESNDEAGTHQEYWWIGPMEQHDACDVQTASWHPAVALAVADWLDTAVEWSARDEPEFEAALAVARAYLGETS